jgi:hypothetical protein
MRVTVAEPSEEAITLCLSAIAAGKKSMESTVDVFLIQEGRDPNPSGKAYFTLPAAESGAVLGLSDKLEYHASEMPPRFGPPSPNRWNAAG